MADFRRVNPFKNKSFMTAPSNWHHEDGFEFALFPAKNGKAKQLVVVLHGHGSNAKNWEEHAKQMQTDMPDADVITVQGPVKLPLGPDGVQGYSWTSYQGPMVRQVKETLTLVFNRLPVADKLNRFLDNQLKKRGLDDDHLGLVGSSMGSIAALQTALSRKKAIAGLVSHSGALLPFTKVRSKPDILLIMGGKDEVFSKPQPASKKGMKRAFNKLAHHFSVQHPETLRRLRKKHIPFTEKFYPDMKHETTPDSIAAGNTFLISCFKNKDKAKPQPPKPR